MPISSSGPDLNDISDHPYVCVDKNSGTLLLVHKEVDAWELYNRKNISKWVDSEEQA